MALGKRCALGRVLGSGTRDATVHAHVHVPWEEKEFQDGRVLCDDPLVSQLPTSQEYLWAFCHQICAFFVECLPHFLI